MPKFLLIFCFICFASYLIFFFLLPCIKLFKDGEESELYKKVSDEIVDYLKEKCGCIENVIFKKEQFISELENYKKSLIYEYVTGKKEVPEI